MSDTPTTANGAPDGESAVMPLMEHLKELRIRLIRAFIALAITTAVSFAFAKQVFVILLAPLGDVNVALLSGMILAMPFIVYQIGRFIAPGLTKKERRYLILLVPGATLCFVTGVAFAYFVMLPAALPFLGSFMADLIEQNWSMQP